MRVVSGRTNRLVTLCVSALRAGGESFCCSAMVSWPGAEFWLSSCANSMFKDVGLLGSAIEFEAVCGQCGSLCCASEGMLDADNGPDNGTWSRRCRSGIRVSCEVCTSEI